MSIPRGSSSRHVYMWSWLPLDMPRGAPCGAPLEWLVLSGVIRPLVGAI